MSEPLDNKIITDLDLVRKISHKDADALAMLYDRYAPRLYGLALKILKDTAQAEDILQDLFLSLWENAENFDPNRGQLMTWLMVLCRNRCIDRLRAGKVRVKKSTSLDKGVLDNLIPDESMSPLQIVDQIDKERMMKAAMAALPNEQRQLIELAYYEGLSQSEIADQLDIPLGTVKTRIRLGMKKLRGYLENELY